MLNFNVTRLWKLILGSASQQGRTEIKKEYATNTGMNV